MNYLEEFKNRIMYRTAAIIVLIMSIVFFGGLIYLRFPFYVAIFVLFIFLGVTFLVSTRYACPKCEKRFMLFAKISQYEYCPHCGEHIFIIDEDKEEKL